MSLEPVVTVPGVGELLPLEKMETSPLTLFWGNDAPTEVPYILSSRCYTHYWVLAWSVLLLVPRGHSFQQKHRPGPQALHTQTLVGGVQDNEGCRLGGTYSPPCCLRDPQYFVAVQWLWSVPPPGSAEVKWMGEADGVPKTGLGAWRGR